MPKHISFMEAVQRMEEIRDPMQVMTDETMMQFIEDVDTAGADILKQKDEKYLSELVQFIQSVAVSELISRGGIEFISLLMSKRFREVIVVVLKYSVGISAIEELH